MKITKKQLREAVKEVIKEVKENTITMPKVKPGIKEKPAKAPNPLTPPKHAPKPKPKGYFSEGTIDKIASRFSKLKKKPVNEVSMENLESRFVATGKITQEVFDEIKQVSSGKSAYATWLVLRVVDKAIMEEDIYKFADYFKLFERYKNRYPKKDINQIKTLRDVNEFIDKSVDIADLIVKQKQKAQQSAEPEDPKNLVDTSGIQALKDVGINYIGDVDGYQVFEIPQALRGNSAAWKAYTKYLANCAGRADGAKISICTMASMEHFNNYLKSDDLYVFYNLKDPKSPYQFHYRDNQFMDKDDRSILKQKD